MELVDILSIITIAFLGSFGHCVGMCGGIVVAYSSLVKENKILSHLLYSFGRVTTYMLLGAIFGFVGGVFVFNNITIAIMWIISGIVMILAGYSLIGKIKFLTIIEHSISNSKWYKQNFQKLISSNSYLNLYLLGLLNGLLPCGLVYFFAISAASSGSSLYGAIIMGIFGLSTIPVLFSLGYFVDIIRLKSRKTFLNLTSIIIILYGFYTIYHGYTYIKYPNKTLSECCEVDIEK